MRCSIVTGPPRGLAPAQSLSRSYQKTQYHSGLFIGGVAEGRTGVSGSLVGSLAGSLSASVPLAGSLAGSLSLAGSGAAQIAAAAARAAGRFAFWSTDS